MNKIKKHRVAESFGDFIGATEVMQKGNSIQPAHFGANPDSNDDTDLPFEFERRPEIGGNIGNITLLLDKIQSISNAGINKSKLLDNKGHNISPYIERQINLAYKHLREGYLRMMDMNI